jgi:DNA-binding XRE family transcriptional regulator
MTDNIVVYLACPDKANSDRQMKAIANFGLQRDWPIPRSAPPEREPFLRSEWVFEELTPGPLLDAALQATTEDTKFVLFNLGSLSHLPSRQQELIAELHRKRSEVYVLELGGIIDPHMHALRVAWKAARELEHKFAESEARLVKREAEMKIEMALYSKTVMKEMAELYGLPDFVRERIDGPKTNGHDTETPTAAHLKSLREAAGLSQQDLADKLGVSKSTIFALEQSGRGPHLERALEVLSPPSLGGSGE